MGVHARLINHDEVFASLPFNPVVANNYDISNPQSKELLKQHLITAYNNSDTIDEGASCDCGAFTGMYNMDLECKICHTRVVSTTDRPIESTLWIKAPDGVKGLINIEAWMILSSVLSSKNFSVLRWLTDTRYRPDPEKSLAKNSEDILRKLEKKGITRGLNNFIEHFDEIITFLFESNIIQKSKTRGFTREDLWQFIQENKHNFFPKHLPIPSRLCFILENTSSAIYVDQVLRSAFNAVWTMAGIKSSKLTLRHQVVENRTVRSLESLAEFYDEYTRVRLARKPGTFRRHVFGTRLHFSARGVITSLSQPHRYDEIHVPWGLACQLLKYHLCNKLLKQGYTPNEALNFVYGHVRKYNAELDRMFQELIAESPEGGLAIMLSRNPTLQRGSTQRLRITKVKTDPHNNAIAMSVLILKAPIQHH